MGDFTPKSVVKSAVRELATPFASVAALTTVVSDILTNNPFECTAYEVSGTTHDPVEKTRESYTARFIYEDLNAETIGTASVKCPTVDAFNDAVTALPACTGLNTAIGATAVHESEDDTFAVVLKCHDANGELYNVSFSRSAITVSGYEADAILTAVETWADTVSALD